MNAIHIRKMIDSETLHLPELKPFVGRMVEIIVLDESDLPLIRPGTGDWEAAERAAQQLRETGYDFDAWRELRGLSREDKDDHQP